MSGPGKIDLAELLAEAVENGDITLGVWAFRPLVEAVEAAHVAVRCCARVECQDHEKRLAAALSVFSFEDSKSQEDL